MSDPHNLLAAYVDGELTAHEAEAFARHLVDCAACSEALHDAFQLIALEAAARGEGRKPVLRSALSTPVTPIHAVRGVRWRRARVPAGALAVAALILIVVTWPRELPRITLATAPVRGMEGRISYAAADVYRPYDVERGGSAAVVRDQVPFAAFAQLERRGDFHGVAAASLLMGDSQRAATYLASAEDGVQVAADRALLALSTGHPAAAVIALDAVLSRAGAHAQALWNRGLALRDLGLSLAAAEAFTAVAALDEPGWAAEAAMRARTLADEVHASQAAFARLAMIDGPRLASAPDSVSPEVARRFPGMARLELYNAVRSATSAAAVRALAPLARTLDGVYGGEVLARYVDRIARTDFARRAPLAARFAAVVADPSLDASAARALFAELRRAGDDADDLLLGALYLTAPAGHVDPADLPELRRLADASGDPWFQLLAVESEVDALIYHGDRAAAEALALPVLAICQTSRLDYRCVRLALILADSYVEAQRLGDARQLLDAYRDRARRGGEWYLEEHFLETYARLAMFDDDVAGSTLPLARAYTHELVLRRPDRCDFRVWSSELLAVLLVNRPDLVAARGELARADAARVSCPTATPSDWYRFAAAHVLRDPKTGSAGDVERLRALIADARSREPDERAMLDQVEGRLLIDRDRATAAMLLERAIGEADAPQTRGAGNMNLPRARMYAYAVLILDAGRAGQWDRAWLLLERADRISAAARCTLGAAADDDTALVVVRDAHGVSQGEIVVRPGHAAGSENDGPQLVPARLRDALRDCPEVEVIARPPVQGLPALLPPEMAWSYRMGEGGARSEPGPRDENRGAPIARKRVVVANVEPPVALRVAHLSPWRSSEAPDVALEGPAATPTRALAEIADATVIEIHSHGVADAAAADASLLMLSPDDDGGYALTAAAIARHPLRHRPLVILAACQAARAASYRHETWSLPAAFITAGARAVIASSDVIDDDGAGALFDDVRNRILQGASPAIALRDARARWLRDHPTASWLSSLMVFQ